MPTIGLDCQLILDTNGYFIEPHSYQVIRPRVARTDLLGQAASPSHRRRLRRTLRGSWPRQT
jgi:hypothetical protein